MPTTVSESDLFATSFQRPNNGELADAASLLQFLQVLGNSRRYLYNRAFTGNYDVTRYGFVGSGAVDDSGPIQDAHDAADAAGGGTVWIPSGKSARCDSKLEFSGRVALRCMKGNTGSAQTRLIRNHADVLLELDNDTFVADETPTLIEGFKFEDLNGNTNPLVDVTDGSLTLLRCWATGLASAGPLVKFAGGSESWLRLYECYLAPQTGQSAVLHQVGQVLAEGSTFKVPDDYSSYLIDVESISAFDPAVLALLGNYFDASDQTLGEGGAVLAHGSYWDVTATGNTFRTETQDFTAFSWASSFATARRLVERGNIFHLVTPHEPNGNPLPADCELSLLGTYRADIGAATTVTIPDSRSTVMVRTTSATATTVTMPTAMVVGQKLRVILYNAGGSAWSVAPTFTASPPVVTVSGWSLPTALGSGQTMAVDFEVLDIATAGNYVWTRVGVSP